MISNKKSIFEKEPNLNQDKIRRLTMPSKLSAKDTLGNQQIGIYSTRHSDTLGQ